MYRITTKSPLREYKFLKAHNRSGLTFLEHCYGIGVITMKEWEQFRGVALRGGLNG